MRRRTLRTVLTVGLLVLVGWIALPTTLGGQSAYVVTHGNSMAPRFHTGDLAILRSSGTYAVGDVVAYRSRLLHTTVMHRIVAVHGDGYVFKGDHNTFLDPEHPHRDQLIGTLRVRVPQGGVWLTRLTHPVVLAVVALILFLTGTTQATRPRGRRRRGTPVTTTPWMTPPRTALSPAASTAARRTALAAAAILAAVGVLLALVAWQAPRERDAHTAAPDGPSTTFAYRAAVADSPAYDGRTVTSPDPVFRRLANLVQVDVRYTGPPGTMAVTANVAAPSGWHTSMPLQPATTVSGTAQRTTVQLDLNRIDARAQAAARAIGIPYDQLTIAIVASVRTREGQQLTPTLPLVLSAAQLKLAGGPSTLTVAAPATQPQQPGAGRVHVLGYSSTPRAMLLTAIGALLCAALLGLLTTQLANRYPRDEARAIQARHGRLLLPIKTPPAGDPGQVLQVQDFAALARIADRYGVVVMTWTDQDCQNFMVQDQGTRYQYTLPYERHTSRSDRRHAGTSAQPAATDQYDASATAS